MSFPKSVMIVEDELIAQTLLTQICEKRGIQVKGCVDNADDALEISKKEDYDLLLMDININGPIDGLRLASRLQSMKEFCLIFATAYIDDDIMREVDQIKPYGYIVKPYTIKDIEATINTAYSRYLEDNLVGKQENHANMEDIAITKDIVYSKKSMAIYYKNKKVDLSLKAIKLIDLLSKNLNQSVSYEAIFDAVWDGSDNKEASLRTLVYNIRKTLPELPIAAYNKFGYILKQELD